MPTIILNKATTNPNIPMVPVYGFYDDFNRPDADVLGLTSGESKAWVTLNPSATFKFAIRSNMLGITGAGAAGGETAVVDAQTANGTLEAKISGAVSGARPIRMAARVKDSTNYLALFIHESGFDLRRYVNGAYTVVGSATGQSPVGKTLAIQMIGTSISVLSDGVQVIAPVEVPEFATETRHGAQMSAASVPDDRFDFIRFTPA